MSHETAMEPTPPIADPGGDGWRAELGATLRLSWPLAAANLLQMLTYAIDVIFIARLGEDQLAASALAIALFGLVLWALSGLTGAVAPVAAMRAAKRVRSAGTHAMAESSGSAAASGGAGSTTEIIASGDFEFEPHWRPTAVEVGISELDR